MENKQPNIIVTILIILIALSSGFGVFNEANKEQATYEALQDHGKTTTAQITSITERRRSSNMFYELDLSYTTDNQENTTSNILVSNRDFKEIKQKIQQHALTIKYLPEDPTTFVIIDITDKPPGTAAKKMGAGILWFIAFSMLVGTISSFSRQK